MAPPRGLRPARAYAVRNMSFSMTTAQVIARLKDVTRRVGWLFLLAGMILMACEKCQGLGKGGKIKKLGRIRVKNVRRERLNRMTLEPAYGADEVRREGFPDATPAEFVAFFCKGHGCLPSDMVTRIEFEYLD